MASVDFQIIYFCSLKYFLITLTERKDYQIKWASLQGLFYFGKKGGQFTGTALFKPRISK